MLKDMRQNFDRWGSLLAVRPASRTVSFRTEVIVLSVILVVAAWLRFSTIASHSIWIDEGYTYAISKLSLQHLINVPIDVHPAVFFAIVHLFSPEAGDATSLRLPAAIASLASLIPIYFVSRWLFGNVGALTVTALNATAYTNLVFANDARNYSLLMLLSILLLAALLRFSQYWLVQGEKASRPALLWASVYTLSCIAALYTHQIALIFILCANAAMLAMYASSPRQAVSNALQLIVVNIVVVIAWLPLVFRMASVSSGIDWLEQAGPVEVVREIIAMVMPNKIGFLLMGIYAAALLVAAVILVQGRRRELILALAFIGLLPGLIWLAGYVFQPVFLPRTIIPVLFGSTILFGAIAAFGRSAPVAAVCSGAALLTTALSGVQYLNRDLANPWVDNGQPYQDWRSAAADLLDRDDVAILLCSPFPLPSYSFYDPDAALYVSAAGGGFWSVTEDDWRDLFGLPLSERGWHGVDPMTRVLLAKGREEIDAKTLAEEYSTIALLTIVYTAGRDCREEVFAQFRDIGEVSPQAHSYTGLERWDIQRAGLIQQVESSGTGAIEAP